MVVTLLAFTIIILRHLRLGSFVPGAVVKNRISGGCGEEAGHHGGEVGGPAQGHTQLRIISLLQMITRGKTHIT